MRLIEMRLIESNAKRPRRRGGLLLSAAVHVVLLALAVVSTLEAEHPGAELEPEALTYVAPPRDPAPATPAAPARPHSPTAEQAAPSFPALAPLPIDLTRIPDAIPAPGAEPRFDPARGLFDAAARLSTAVAPACGAGAEGCARGTTGSAPLTGREVDREVVLLGPAPRPRYPEALRAAGVDGRVVIRVVVDTVGRVERASLTVVAATHPLFVPAVEQAVARMRFRPAEAGGRRVRQLVEIPFEFVLDR